MKTKRFTSTTVAFLVVVGLILGIPPVSAGVTGALPDHLKCYRVRDSLPGDSAVLELFTPQFQSFEQCDMQVRARFLCAETIKRSVNGDPVTSGFPEAGDFMCYRVGCAEDGFFPPDREILVADQFGERPVRVGRAAMLCAPARKTLPPSPQ